MIDAIGNDHRKGIVNLFVQVLAFLAWEGNKEMTWLLFQELASLTWKGTRSQTKTGALLFPTLR